MAGDLLGAILGPSKNCFFLISDIFLLSFIQKRTQNENFAKMTSSKGPPFGPKERSRNYENGQKMMPWKPFCWFLICSQNVTFYNTFEHFGLEKMTEKGRNWRQKAGFKIYGKSIEFNENVVFYSLSGVQQCSRMTNKWPKTCLFLLWQRRPKSLFGMLSGTPQNRHFFDLGSFLKQILL